MFVCDIANAADSQSKAGLTVETKDEETRLDI